jgi:hypothetical protein
MTMQIVNVTTPHKVSTANFSIDGLHRYQLTRTLYNFDNRPQLTVGYCGINPSIADALVDDQTVTKLVEFTRRMRGTKMIVFNAFSLISTDPHALVGEVPPNNQNSNYWIEASLIDCDIIIPMWGNRSKVSKELRPRFDQVLAMICTSGKPVYVFGWTKSRDPMHPLMLPYSRQLTKVLP